MTTSQQVALLQFKERVKDILAEWQDDPYLQMWIDTHGPNIADVEDQFRKKMEWRKKMRADTILTAYQPPKVLSEYYAGGYPGHDKDGGAIKLELLGQLDMHGLIKAATSSQFYKYKLYETETMVKDLRERGGPLGLTIIIDMEGVGLEWLWLPGADLYVKLANLVEENYPGIVKRVIVVNSPMLFPMIWKLVKPILNENLRTKVEVLAENQAEVLLEYISADQLPAYLGGTQTDPDGNRRCVSKVCQGGKVPDAFYLNTPETNADGMTTVVVPMKGQHKVTFNVEYPDSVISYEFRTENNDIGFSVVKLTPEGDRNEVLQPKRIQCHPVAAEGAVVCARPGTYDVIFDNSYSVLTAKTLYYRLQLHQTDDVTDDEVAEMMKA